ncbi:hypothetical protein [Corallococcus llansteffanensis]|uniref:Beta-ketoacyl-[acyl-carrier-protein] synthase III N-terminal domain-containing protein n=1 Tax=Corallococcus llansteffanensis TaxID=2316731 RepID=A0A3A8QYT2_9BACT|nr:hypothetical protein [Corallococcus llansteffanensis]RKH68294.1 hypothetical protein D7V93_01630 [Corallococcus llansteffanensis]
MFEQELYLLATNYTLGEQQGHYSDLREFPALLEKSNMENNPELWGWGGYHASSRTYLELAATAAKRTLEQSRCAPAEVDALYLCGSAFPNDFVAQNVGLGSLLSGLGLVNAVPRAVQGAGCASLLSGLICALQALRSGACRNILMVGVDVFGADAARFYEFCLLSDSACSFLISSTHPGAYRFLDAQLISDPELMANTAGNSFSRQSQLHARSMARLTASSSVKVEQISRLFASNLFLPIQRMYAAVAGYRKKQLYTDNVARIGHCSSADSIINLTDHAGKQPPGRGEYFMLQSSAHGHVANVLLQAQ